MSNEEVYELVPEAGPEPEPYQLTLDEVMAARRAAYQMEADPLFFGSERGENTRAEWEAKIEEIKARWPKPAVAPA